MEVDRSSPDPRYGAWKSVEEIGFDDLKANPVWLWCMGLDIEGEEDGPLGGDETSMRPLLGAKRVPDDVLCEPLILLRVKGTDRFASGFYDPKLRSLFAIRVLGAGGGPPNLVPGLPTPAIYISVPELCGRSNVEFAATGNGADEAAQSPGS
jgi:hypothetical protein